MLHEAPAPGSLLARLIQLKLYYDQDWSTILDIFCSSCLLGRHCHSDYVCHLVEFIMLANLS